ncbi:MAG: sulfite exporter TauE/SafE family protein [Actinobacteria bacterium]|nr:sulfite exporter TauE/SafE family protein [Actinomycetota bacterium]
MTITMAAFGLLLAVFMGLALGLLGGGGSILAVPILVYVLGFGAKEAVAASLVVVGVTSLFGAAEHWREGHIRFRVALVFGSFAAAGAYLGAQLAGFLSGAVQLSLFAVVMLVAAFFMFRDNGPSEDGKDSSSDGAMGRLLLWLAAPGLGVGVLTGLVGVGGGFLIVPALVLIAEVPMEAAVGTSLLIIAMNSFAGFAGYLGEAEIQWGLMTLFTVLAVVGSFAGAYLVQFVPQSALKRSFAVLLVIMAGFIFYENRGVFF